MDATPVPRPVAEFAAMSGTRRERPGMSALVLEDGVVYHTYSTYSRGLDGLWGMYHWLDCAPNGRNETGVRVAAPRRVQQGPSDFGSQGRAIRQIAIVAWYEEAMSEISVVWDGRPGLAA
jgi:predicted dithiol-disulfide oxidoreductase (DUF899 family)